MGYSVGKWDNDTPVVETTGFNDRGWLDDGGHPQTESLHVTERFRSAGAARAGWTVRLLQAAPCALRRGVSRFWAWTDQLD